jgi:hypothetical protein
MRGIEKVVAILILALSAWTIIMWAATRFQGNETNRILRIQLGSDAADLNQAVAADDSSGVPYNIRMVIRNTHMDYVFILLYWLTFVSLAFMAGSFGARFLAVCAGLLISGAVIGDLLENSAILTAMRVNPFTDAVAVDISLFSEWKWAFFFLASLLLGLAFVTNRHLSTIRRIIGGLFIASGLLGLLGISQYRVALEFSLWVIDLAVLLVAAALLLTLWKFYQSRKELDPAERLHHVRANA